MSDVKPKDRTESPSVNIAWAYLACAVLNLPLAIIFWKNLTATRPYFNYLPLIVVALGVMLWFRWPRSFKLRNSVEADGIIIVAAVLGLINCLVLSPYLAFAACIGAIASFLLRVPERDDSKRNLGSFVWPLLPVLLAIPVVNLDVTINEMIQQRSEGFAVNLMDVIGFGHYVVDDGLYSGFLVAPKIDKLNLSELCNGSFSFFALLMIGFLIGVLFRRTSFRIFILGCSAVFWAIVINTTRIGLIPVLNRLGMDFDITASQGLIFEAMMIFSGLVLLFSTDQFMTFLFGPVDPDLGSSSSRMYRSLIKFWNGLSGSQNTESQSTSHFNQPISPTSNMIILGAAGLLAVSGLWQGIGLFRSMSQVENASMFGKVISHEFAQSDLPGEIGNWKLAVPEAFLTADRQLGNSNGVRSDMWVYDSDLYRMQVALDQGFAGWNELTKDYERQGWSLVADTRTKVDDDTANDWPFIEVELTRETGERGYLLFSEFDLFGKPLNAPTQVQGLFSFGDAFGDKMANSVSGRLLRPDTYQTQVLARSFRELPAEKKAEIKSNFLSLREELRNKFMQKQGGTAPTQNESTQVSDASN